MHIAQQKRGTVFFGQAADGSGEPSAGLAAVGGALGGVALIGGVKARFFQLLQGFRLPVFALAQFIEAYVGGDAVQPRGKARLRLVGGKAAPCAHQCLLRHIGGILFVAHHAQAKTVGDIQMRRDECFERLLIAARCPFQVQHIDVHFSPSVMCGHEMRGIVRFARRMPHLCCGRPCSSVSVVIQCCCRIKFNRGFLYVQKHTRVFE